jgi:hypothetical protein
MAFCALGYASSNSAAVLRKEDTTGGVIVMRKIVGVFALIGMLWATLSL